LKNIQNRKRSILVISPFSIYDYNGGSLYTHQMVEALSEDFNVDVICLEQPKNDTNDKPNMTVEHYSGLISRIPRYFYLLSKKPTYSYHYKRQKVLTLINQYLSSKEYDLLICCHRLTSWLILNVNIAIRKIYIMQNDEALSIRSMSQYYNNQIIKYLIKIEADKTDLLERSIIDRADKVIGISKNDFHTMGINSGEKFGVVSIARDEENIQKKGGIVTLVYIGNMEWKPKKLNIELFIQHVFIPLRDKYELKLIVAGRGSTAIKSKFDLPDISYLERYDSESSLFTEKSIVIVPEKQDGGLKIKTITSASYGIPIVSTKQGIEGTGLENGESCMVANDFKEFIDRIDHLVKHPEEAILLGKRAKEIIKQNNNKQVIQKSWISEISKVV